MLTIHLPIWTALTLSILSWFAVAGLARATTPTERTI